MKAAPFDYVLAQNIEETTQYLADGNGDAFVLAGGQTLMPMLAMRLARPSILIDINSITELSGIEETNEEITIKACTRQADAISSSVIQKRLPLLAYALTFVGHSQTRNRGTIGGSLAHADPASEIPLVALTMNAEISLRSFTSSRRVSAAEFFLGPMMTTREPTELLASLHFPLSEEGTLVGTGFHEMSERHGDFALVAVATRVELNKQGTCLDAAVAFGGVDDTPVRIEQLENKLRARVIDETAMEIALSEIYDRISPVTDQHATAAYRKRIAVVLARRAILDAVKAAKRNAA